MTRLHDTIRTNFPTMPADMVAPLAKVLNKTDRTEGEQEFISHVYNTYYEPATKTEPKEEPATKEPATKEPATKTDKPKETLNTLIEKYKNFIPVFEVARIFNSSYERLWSWIYSLMRADHVTVYSLQEGMNYNPTQLSWIDSQGLFFIEFPVVGQTERQRLGLET